MATTKKQQPDGEGYTYPEYDKWRVSMKTLSANKDEDAPRRVEFTCVEVLQSGIKIEDHIASEMNRQSQNNFMRYYPKGSVNNGHKEEVNIK